MAQSKAKSEQRKENEKDGQFYTHLWTEEEKEEG